MLHKTIALVAVGVLWGPGLGAAAGTNQDPKALDAERGKVVILGRINQIAGSTSSVIMVRIPRPSRVNIADYSARRSRRPNEDIRIRGDGRFAGVMLIPEPPDPTTSRNQLVAGRWGDCDASGCDPDVTTNYVRGAHFGRKPHYKSLSPGLYRLHLIADDTPVWVTLRLRGLTGVTRIRPRDPAPVDLDTPRMQYALEQGRSIWAAGNTYHAKDIGGMVLLMITVTTERFEHIEIGGCVYAFPTAPPEKLFYGPHCNTLTGLGLGGAYQVSYTPSGSPRREVLSITGSWQYGQSLPFPNVDDRYGAGVWYSSEGTIDDVFTQGLFLIYEE